jgi:hypothetical protein
MAPTTIDGPHIYECGDETVSLRPASSPFRDLGISRQSVQDCCLAFAIPVIARSRLEAEVV